MSEKYRFKTRPYHHQVAALKKLISTGFGGALLMEPRTGKTKVAIDYASMLHQVGRVERVLVICPVVAFGVWIDQLKTNCPFPYDVVLWDNKGRKKVGLPPARRGKLQFVIMNYDAFSTPGQAIRKDRYGTTIRSKSRGGRYDAKRNVIKWAPQLVILDESHRIKSPSAKKSKAIHSLQKIPDYRLILTGTVVTKSKRLFDVYSQWQFLNPDRFADYTFKEFKYEFGRWVHRNNYDQWISNRNEDKLHQLIHQDAFSITREECYDLPEQTSQILWVDLEESAEVYDAMAEDMVARIHTGEITEASIRLVQRLRLQQITSGLTKTSPSAEYPQGRLVIVGDEKLRALQSRLEDLMEADEKVVIGALFKADILRIKTLTEKMKIPTFRIQGGMKSSEREYAWQQFPKTRGGAVFIGQPAAAGEAIDLSAASILMWYSLTPSWVNFRQFSDRIALSHKPTFHEFLLARSTVDVLLKETLDEDGDIGKKMITSPERLLRISGNGSLTS